MKATKPRKSHRCLPRVAGIALFAAMLAIATAPSPATQPAAPPAHETLPKNVRSAVDRGLAYLAAQQKADGNFPTGNANGNIAGTTAVPSLVVLAFLADGNAPGHGQFGAVVNKAIDYILGSQRPDGLFARGMIGNVMYEHGISTLMLTQARNAVDPARQARIDKALAKSVALILAAQQLQKPPQYQGGWRYQPGSHDSDLSCTDWQLLALRGAAACNMAHPIPPAAFTAARDFVKRCAAPTGGFAYVPGSQPNPARTAIGITCLELTGPPNSPESLAGGDWLLTHPPDAPDIQFYYYALYHYAHAVDLLGGKYFSQLYPPLRDALLTRQQKDGSFDPTPPNDPPESNAGPSYCTALACLALCVPEHRLTVYERDAKK